LSPPPDSDNFSTVNSNQFTRFLIPSVVLLAALAGTWKIVALDQPAAAQPTAPATAEAIPPAPTTRPVVYISSPYTKGDPAINTHFQCKIFDQMMNDGIVWPVAPLWAHFQHTIFPRPYQDWFAYDMALIPRYDACLRLNAEDPQLNYIQTQSAGADKEVAEFRRLGKPVFYSLDDLYKWAKTQQH
jgi:hypothetical protein